jgi:hypothetical protein
MHPPVWFPAPAYQGSRLWGRAKGEGEGEGELVGFLGLPTPFRGRSSNIAAVEFPILLKGACGDHWSGFALLVTV